MDSGRSKRLPIFRDDLAFGDRFDSPFRDMQDHMERDLGHFTRRDDWDEDFDQMCQDFFSLKPRPPRLSSLKGKKDDGGFGSRDSLDDHTMKQLYVENPKTNARDFQISFDVKEYDPQTIALKVEGDTLMVEAKCDKDDVDGAKSVKEFSRNIKIPKDVDSDKLSSTLSKDGILTVSAPMPPVYQSIPSAEKRQLPARHRAEEQPELQAPSASLASPPPSYSSMPSQPPSYVSPPPSYASQPPSYASPPPSLSNQYSVPASHASPPPSLSNQYSSPAASHASPPPSLSNQYSSPAASHASPPPSLSNYSSPAAPAPSAAAPTPAQRSTSPPLDTPTYSNTELGRKMELALEIEKPYTPDDIIVKVEGSKLYVEAEHEEVADKRSSRTSMSRQFDLTEDIEPSTVQASLGTDRRLRISASVPTLTE